MIGIGNRLRRDDGIGHEVVEALPPTSGVVVWAVPGILPELAVRLQGVDRVLLVDADATSDEIRLARLGLRSDWVGHQMSPEGLLSLAREAFGEAPLGWILTVPGYDFGHGEGLSARAAALLPQARQVAASWILGKERRSDAKTT